MIMVIHIQKGAGASDRFADPRSITPLAFGMVRDVCAVSLVFGNVLWDQVSEMAWVQGQLSHAMIGTVVCHASQC